MDWIEEFDKEFIYLEDNPSYPATDVPTLKNDPEGIKAFIQKVEQSARKEERIRVLQKVQELGWIDSDLIPIILEHLEALDQLKEDKESIGVDKTSTTKIMLNNQEVGYVAWGGCYCNKHNTKNCTECFDQDFKAEREKK